MALLSAPRRLWRDRARSDVIAETVRAWGARVRWAPTLALLLPWLLAPVTTSTETRIQSLTAPSSFRLADWETRQIASRLGQIWVGLTQRPELTPADRDAAAAYFSAAAGERGVWRAQAEVAVQRAVSSVLVRSAVPPGTPGGGLFPPVLATLTEPPNVLVISPRAELRVVQSVLMQPLPVAQQEQIEQSAESVGVSSLIAPIGGVATYPAMVLDGPVSGVASAVAHEWVHHYLAFAPLGAAYWSSAEARGINETAADLLGNEIGAVAVEMLQIPPSAGSPPRGRAAEQDFDFRAFMRATRLRVEEMLASGSVDEAEAYMRAQQEVLARNGYAIRRLNQAYFAFYGSYGEGFAASSRSPVPGLVRRLRAESASVGEFLTRLRSVTSIAELRQAAGG